MHDEPQRNTISIRVVDTAFLCRASAKSHVNEDSILWIKDIVEGIGVFPAVYVECYMPQVVPPR